MKKVFFALVGALIFYQLYQTTPPIIQTVKHNDVILYATSWCGYCKKTREFLAENNIQYTEYDVEASEQGRRKFAVLNAKGVPVLDIQGTIIDGYDVSKTKKVLSAANLM
jgi:glutaredoxin